MKKIVNLTHYDLDGVCCSIPLLKYFEENIEIIPTTYGSLMDKKIQQIKNNYSSKENELVLFVTDLSLTLEQIQNIIDIGNLHYLFYFDHHKIEDIDVYKEQLSKMCSENNVKFKFIHDESKSGSLITWEYLKSLFQNKEHLNKYITSIDKLILYSNTYDLWKTDDKENFIKGKLYNNLFWEIKFIAFKEYFINGDCEFDSDMTSIIDRINEKIDYYFIKVKEDIETDQENLIEFLPNGKKILTYFDANYISEYELRFPDINYFIFITPQKNAVKISFRQQEEDKINVFNFCKYIENTYKVSCGGHEYVFGINITEIINIDDVTYEIINDIIKFINDNNNK